MKTKLINLENGKILTRNINPKYINLRYNLFDLFGRQWELIYKNKYKIIPEGEEYEKLEKMAIQKNIQARSKGI